METQRNESLNKKKTMRGEEQKEVGRGGAREGAGRPEREVPRRSICVRLEEEEFTWLKEACLEEGVSYSRWVQLRVAKERG